MKESELKKKLEELNIPWQSFIDFIIGQTIQMHDGESFYFEHDIDTFFTQHYTGIVDEDFD